MGFPKRAKEIINTAPGAHPRIVLVVAWQECGAGVLACGFERRLAACIQRTADPGSGTLPEPAAVDGCATRTMRGCAPAPGFRKKLLAGGGRSCIVIRRSFEIFNN